MEMKTRIALAKKRRAKYLKELMRSNCTIASLALKHNMSPARMAQLLNKAKADEPGVT